MGFKPELAELAADPNRIATYDLNWQILRYWTGPNTLGEDICNSREKAERLIAATGIAQTLREYPRSGTNE